MENLPATIGSPTSTEEVSTIVMATDIPPWAIATSIASAKSSGLPLATDAPTNTMIGQTTSGSAGSDGTSGAVAAPGRGTPRTSLTTPQITGIAIGGAATIIVAVGLLFLQCWIRERQRERRHSQRRSRLIASSPPVNRRSSEKKASRTLQNVETALTLPSNQGRFYAPQQPPEEKRRSFWRKSIRPEEIGIAVSPRVPGDHSPVSASSQQSFSRLLPKPLPTVLWPAPLDIEATRERRRYTQRPVSDATEFDDEPETKPQEPERVFVDNQTFILEKPPLSKRPRGPPPNLRLTALPESPAKSAGQRARIPLTPTYDNGNVDLSSSPIKIRSSTSSQSGLPVLEHRLPASSMVSFRGTWDGLVPFRRCLSADTARPISWRRIKLNNYAFSRVRLARPSVETVKSSSKKNSPTQYPSLNSPRPPRNINSSVRAGVTWLTRDLALVDQEEIRAKLASCCDNKSLVKILVLLVTPSLASLLGPGTLLQDVLPSLYAGRRTFQKGKHVRKTITCISAVVDALPVPPEIPGSSNGNPAGAEGVALFMSSENIDARSFPAPMELLDDVDSNAIATVKFCSATEVSSPTRTSDPPSPVRHVTLPTANTVFVNGQRTTLFQDLWRLELSDSEEPAIRHFGRNNLKSFRLNLQCSGDSFVNGGSAPLQALTKPRKIIQSMGNVLRQIEVDDEAVPASRELEKAVSAYIKSNPASTTRGPLLVFALIRSSRTSSSDAAADMSSETQGSGPLKSLWDGARLFKVSGGGGGWGKRQGLLSLEAAVDFETSEVGPSFALPNLDSDQGDLQELDSRGIVPADSTVEFLVRTWEDNSRVSRAKPASLSPPSDSTTVVLGTATEPDSQDCQEDPNIANIGIVLLPDYFGMVSYGGAALGTDCAMSSTQKPSATSRTRCDVPNTRFIIRGVGGGRQGPLREYE
ncbi:hypothetical protein AYL99_11311 [Fonsecaea erecta]|uniref:Uncharacterized protein n=1 Tax=Fonsecaea erecta TaxID=1367422 RepID=A0A178Z6Q4_9EURO|nr:hypothetical protein AYL99_11311 [Fonsecaea erecta]OAP54863.1 hypothetical protein AYL99_11311 [Fonsecaea erecta]